MISVNRALVITPLVTTVAKGRSRSAPDPLLTAMGRKPMLATRAVITMVRVDQLFSGDSPGTNLRLGRAGYGWAGFDVPGFDSPLAAFPRLPKYVLIPST